MSRLQQKVVVKRETAMDSGLQFMGLPVLTSEYFCFVRPCKFRKRFYNKRLWKKWLKRYGGNWEPREDADICGSFILCHPSVVWRFELRNFVDDTQYQTGQEMKYDIHL